METTSQELQSCRSVLSVLMMIMIMAKFGSTQIQTSSSCSSERKKDFGNHFLVFLCFAHVVRYNYLTPLLLELSMWISNLLFEI